MKTLQRRNYTQDRAELDQEAYRRGFLDGYESGAMAAIEEMQVDLFTYADYFNPDPSPGSIFDEHVAAEQNTASKKLGYLVGYQDAFDRGYSNTRKALNQEFEQIRGGAFIA